MSLSTKDFKRPLINVGEPEFNPNAEFSEKYKLRPVRTKPSKKIQEIAKKYISDNSQGFDFTLIEVKDGKVNARGLWKFLEISQQFADWIKYQIESLDLVENEDFHKIVKPIGIKQNGQIDYLLTVDTAKELAIASRTPKGKQARKYFIEAEKKLREITSNSTLPQNYIEALEAHLKSEKEKIVLEGKLQEAQPAIDFHKQVGDSVNLRSIGDFAKTAGIGQNKLFELLRQKKVLISRGLKRNTPYQSFLKAGYFEVKTKIFKDMRVRQTLITGKGEQYLIKQLNK